jgi:hypothetical protein
MPLERTGGAVKHELYELSVHGASIGRAKQLPGLPISMKGIEDLSILNFEKLT